MMILHTATSTNQTRNAMNVNNSQFVRTTLAVVTTEEQDLMTDQSSGVTTQTRRRRTYE